MDKNYLEKIKFDDKGNLIRDEENLWTIIEMLVESANLFSAAIVGLQELGVASSELMNKLLSALGFIPKTK